MFRLLIVEDEDSARTGLQSIFHSIPNLELETASNGKTGYSKALQWHPDIIISDIHMPVWDGLTMIEQLQKKTFSGTIYLLTGYAEFEYVKRALQSHIVEDYILKPVNPPELKLLIENKLKVLNQKKNSQNPQILHLLSEEDSSVLTNGLPAYYTDYFLAVIYMEQERHLPLEVKEALLEEKHHYILSLPDKHCRGILIGFTGHMVNHNALARISTLLRPHKHLACIYETRRTAPFISWFHDFEKLQNAIPWTITCQSVFLEYEPFMEQIPDKFHEDIFFKKDIQRKLCNGDFQGCKHLLLKKFHQMQQAFCHPVHIRTAIVSDLVKLDSKQIYLETINRISSAKTAHEIQTCLNSYFEASEARPTGIQYSSLVQKALYIIEHNYKEPLTLNSVSDQLNITPQYLSRLFMKELSHSFIDYLTSYRMERAKSLLQNTNLKINTICTQVGYPDPKYFCTLFKKLTGVTPNQYRSSRTP